MASAEYYREYRKKNKEHLRKYSAQFRETHREELRTYNREYARKRREAKKLDGMSYEDLENKEN